MTLPEPTRIRVARAACRYVGRGAGQGGQVVGLRHPETDVAQRLGVPGQRNRIEQGLLAGGTWLHWAFL